MSLLSPAGFTATNNGQGDVTPYPSGGITALDISLMLDITLGSSSGFLPDDSAVGYRALWNFIDANNNLIQGVPSAEAVIYNPLQPMIVRDLNNILSTMDDVSVQPGSVIDSADYVQTLALPLGATAIDEQNNLIALASKLDTDQGILTPGSDIISVTISPLGVGTVLFNPGYRTIRQYQVGDAIYFNNFVNSSASVINGVQAVAGVFDSGGSTPSIIFNTTASGIITNTSASFIDSGWFRAIPQPNVTDIVATNADLLTLQQYETAIITELQSSRNVREIADSTAIPLNISNVSGNGTTVTVTSTTSSFFDYLAVGDIVELSGTFSGLTPSLIGSFTVSSVTTSSFQFPSTSTGSYTPSSNDVIYRVIRYTNPTQVDFLDPLEVTTTVNVTLTIPIPAGVTTSDFFQIYRSDTVTAVATDVLAALTPDDEDRLVYEAYPTAAQIAAGVIIVTDITPDSFFQGGAYLYTNENTGGQGGIAFANTPPPLAADINRFQNVMFYANTSTPQEKQITLLGVQQIISDYNAGLNPSITIGYPGNTTQYDFVLGIPQVTNIVCGDSTTVSPSADFYLNGATTNSGTTPFYVWFDKTGSDPDPMPPGPDGITGIRVPIFNISSSAQIAQRLNNTLLTFPDYFIPTLSGSTITVTNVNEGFVTDASIISGLASPWAITTTTQGAGQKILPQITTIIFLPGNDYVTSGPADYFTITTPNGGADYFWFSPVGGTATDPHINGYTGHQILTPTGDTAAQVAILANNIISTLPGLKTTISSNIITITAINNGVTIPSINGVVHSGFIVTTTQNGALDVLLSDNISVFLAVQETAQSLINAINFNQSGMISAYYLSGVTDVPGIIELEALNLTVPQFYIMASSANVGSSFNPVLSPTTQFAVSTGNPAVITSSNHGLVTNDQIFIAASTGTPTLNGVQTITVLDANTFSIPINLLSQSSAPPPQGVYSILFNTVNSTNNVNVNRIYYSKLQEPDAVPLLNYFDVGDSDKPIIRIFPLRESLFVFKEDGVWRVSGTAAPFTLELFDSSCRLVCADSLALVNNTLFGYTKKGISAITETGISTVSTPIDNVILSLPTAGFINFLTASFGVGYESDNSYLFFTTSEFDDVVPTICYRYSTLTHTWTTYDKTNNCGLVKLEDDLLYLGCGNEDILEQERKNFTRTDYADHEIYQTLQSNSYLAPYSSIYLSEVEDLNVGDILYQNQLVSIYDFILLLKKLDLDPNVAPAYTITNASWNNGIATFTLSSSASNFLQVGNNIIISNVNPIGFNGIFQITSIVSNIITASISTNPGLYLTGGTLKYSYSDNLTPVPGDDLRETLEQIAAQLDIDPGIDETGFSVAIGDFGGSSVSIIAAPSAIITNTSGTILTGRYISIANSTTNPLVNNFFNATFINSSTFSIPTPVVTSGTGDWETVVEDFHDILACYNILINMLNSNSNTQFKQYQSVTQPNPVETIITAINTNTNIITLYQSGLQYVQGPITFFKSYTQEVQYLPTTFNGDFLSLKHFRESQLFFLNKAFTFAQLEYSSDLIPMVNNIQTSPVTLYGNGIFGNEAFGQNYFGGSATSAPIRTYVPRNNQKSRFLRIGFSHVVARESFLLLGITIVGRSVSSRAYR